MVRNLIDFRNKTLLYRSLITSLSCQMNTTQLPKMNTRKWLAEKKEPLRTWFLEIPSFYLLNFLIEYIVFNEYTAWSTIHLYRIPHPFWIGIFLFGLVYGVFEGVLSGFLSAILLLYFLPYELGWNPLEWGTSTVLPTMFVIVGALAGITNMLLLENVNDLRIGNEELQQKIQDLDHLNIQMISTNLRLESRIVSRFDTFRTLFDAAKELSSLELGEILQEIPEIVSNIFGSEKCSLYLKMKDGSLRLRSLHGWKKNEDFQNRFTPEHPLAIEVSRYTTNKLWKPEEMKQLSVDAAFVVSLVDRHQELYGVIKIEEINYMKITASNIQILLLLSNWMIEAVENCNNYANRENSSVIDQETGVLKEKIFWVHLKKRLTSALRNKFELVVMFLHLNVPLNHYTSEYSHFIVQVGELLKKEFRGEDEIARFGEGIETEFIVMLPYTDFSKSLIPLRRLKVALEELVNSYNQENEELIYHWEVLSLLDGSLFLNDIVNERLQMI